MKLYLKSCERFHWPFDDAILTLKFFKMLLFLIALRRNAKTWTFLLRKNLKVGHLSSFCVKVGLLQIDPGCIPLQPPLNFAEFGAPE